MTVEQVYSLVGKVLSFFSSLRNWDSPNPSPAGECGPSRGRAHSLAREVVGESQFRRRDIHRGTVYIYVLCDLLYFIHPPLKIGRANTTSPSILFETLWIKALLFSLWFSFFYLPILHINNNDWIKGYLLFSDPCELTT